MSAVRSETDQRLAPRRGRRRFLANMAAGALALPFLQLGRKPGAQVYYDQYGQPVTVAPGTVVSPVAPAPGAVVTPVAPAAPAPVAPAPAPAYYGPTGVVSQSRRVSRRTSRRGDEREDLFD
jgi:hypothetical protein